jgi:hypothetical protein
MRKELIAGAVAAIVAWPTLAAAQMSPAEQGFHEGGRAAGPVGAIVGGAVGAAVQLPGDVIGFVTGNPRPYVRVEDEIVVGRPLPRRVRVYEIPRHRDYAYAYVNDQRVIVEPRTRRIIRIVE